MDFYSTVSCMIFSRSKNMIMEETLHDHHASISISGRPICDLQFANNIDHIGSSSGKLKDLSNRLVGRARAFGIEVGTEKIKIMTNCKITISAAVSMNNQKLDEMTNFKYLGSTLCKDGTCLAEVCIRIASAMAAVARLNRIWGSNTISFAS